MLKYMGRYFSIWRCKRRQEAMNYWPQHAQKEVCRSSSDPSFGHIRRGITINVSVYVWAQ